MPNFEKHPFIYRFGLIIVLLATYLQPQSALAASSWSNTSNTMTKSRWYHTATLLPDGQVLVVGGTATAAGTIALADTELYDPSTNTWTATGSLHYGRFFHTATLLNNGLVLVAGGYNGTASIDTAELYNPANGTWSDTDSLTYDRRNHTATLLDNGEVLVTGGYTTGSGSYRASTELYNPTSNLWRGGLTMGTVRSLHTATLLPSGKVLVMGGHNAISALDIVQTYDPASNTWATNSALTTARYNHSTSLLANGKILMAGGKDDAGAFFATAQVYDPTNDTWDSPFSILSERASHTAVRMPDGMVLLVGGQGAASFNLTTVIYNPANNTFTQTAASPSLARIFLTGAVLQSGKVLISGGKLADTSITKIAEVYNANPTITFGAPPTPTYLGGNFTVSASTTNTDSSTLSYSFVSGPCTLVSGSTFSSTGAGTCLVQADGAATTNYNSGAQTQSITIARATPTLAVTNSPVYNGSAQAATLSSSVAGTISSVQYAGSATVPTNAGIYALTADFAPTDLINFSPLSGASAGDYTIQQATVTFSAANSPVIYDGAPHAVNLTSSVGGEITNIQYSSSTTPPGAAGSYAVTINFTPTDAVNYTTITNGSVFTHIIQKAAAAITFDSAPTPIFPDSDFIVSATATGGGTITFSKISGPCALVSGATFSVAGTGSCVVKAVSAASTNYIEAVQPQTITISAATPRQCFVKADAGPTNDGAAWGTAFTDLQSALGSSGCTEVWVASGTYRPTTDANRAATFQLTSGVPLYGGFTGSETALSQRSLSNPSVLSGEIGAAGISDNVYHVVTGASGATLDGFTITAGNANSGTVCPGACGGGLYNSTDNVTLSNLTFTANTASGSGGGMYNSGNELSLLHANLSTNSAANGGGLYSTRRPVIQNTTFSQNTATTDGGGLYSGGESFLNLTFSSNSAGRDGGGLYTNGAGTIANATISGNTAGGGGGGMYAKTGAVSVYHTTITGNNAVGTGKGIYFNNSSSRLESTIVWNNGATNTGNVGGSFINPNKGPVLPSQTTSGTDNLSAPNVTYVQLINVITDACVSFASCTDRIFTDPRLGTLGDNGGATQTIPLLAGSSAIDAGYVGSTGCAPADSQANWDQRGVARNDLRCDIGAFEVSSSERVAEHLNVSSSAVTTFGPALAGLQRDAAFTNPGVITVTRSASWAIQGSESIQAWWTIEPQVTTNIKLKLKLCYIDSESNTLALSDLKFWRFDGTTWVDMGAPDSIYRDLNGNNCATLNSVQEFSTWTLGTSRPTALRMTRFEARPASLPGLLLGGMLVLIAALWLCSGWMRLVLTRQTRR